MGAPNSGTPHLREAGGSTAVSFLQSLVPHALPKTMGTFECPETWVLSPPVTGSAQETAASRRKDPGRGTVGWGRECPPSASPESLSFAHLNGKSRALRQVVPKGPAEAEKKPLSHPESFCSPGKTPVQIQRRHNKGLPWGRPKPPNPWTPSPIRVFSEKGESFKRIGGAR